MQPTPEQIVAFGVQHLLSRGILAGQIIKIMTDWEEHTPSDLHRKLLGKPAAEDNFQLGNWQAAAFRDDYPIYYRTLIMDAWKSSLLSLLRTLLLNKRQKKGLINDLIDSFDQTEGDESQTSSVDVATQT